MSFLDARMRVLIKNVFGSAAARFVNLFITLALVPLTINALSATDYAYFAMAISLSVLAAYADLGMGLAVVNVVAERGVKQTSGRAQRAVSVVWFSLLAIAACGLLLTSLIAAWLNFGMQSESIHQYNAMLLAAGCVFAGLPTGLVQRILFAEQKNIQANAWSTSARIISLGVVWALVATNYVNLLALVFAVIGVPMLIGWLSVLVVFGKKHIDELRPKWSRYDIRLFRPYLTLGLSFVVLQLAPYVETGIDNLLIGSFIDISLVPAFDVYSKLFTYVPALISIAAYPLWPAIASAKVSGDILWILRVQRIGYISIFLSTFVIALILILFATNVIKVWTNKTLAIELNVIIGFGALCILSSIALFQSMVLNGFGQIKEQLKIFAIYVPFLLTVKVISATSFGVTAMVWSLNFCYLWRLFMANKLIRNAILSLHKG